MQRSFARPLAALATALLLLAATAAGAEEEPIAIGMGMALTGPLAGTGKASLLATEMWIEETNAKGGLLGRPVKLVFYDDQSNPANVPGLYSKLIEVDKVDIVLSGYATNMIAPAMPVVMQHGMMFLGLYGLAVNREFHYDRYFHIVPAGDDPGLDFSRGFIEVAMGMEPKPRTIALLGADAEYPQTALSGARVNARKHGLEIVYDQNYPPGTVDFAPILRAVQAAKPDLVYVASYPADSVGVVHAVRELGLKARMFGGGLIGLQYAALKQQLGAQLNGIVYFDTYVPEPTMDFPGIREFLSRYQAKAAAAGVDPLGFYTPPYAYARMEVLGAAVSATKSLDQAALAQYMHRAVFHTIVGDVKFGPSGEQPEPRTLWVQYRGVVGNDVDQFKEAGKQVILFPPEYKSGDLHYPFGGGR
ncbi:MAG TPA: amino acid ABC transporter substrate-binding protein [Stellaceae bacterium]|nr:amino acid ABC transporter substrate-binding protein [Stellaceae bacterium]